MRSSVTILLFICLALISCSREKPDDRDLLTSHSWRISDLQGKLPGALPQSILAPCDADNQICFKTNGKVLFDYGTNRCDSSEQRFFETDWTMPAFRKLQMAGAFYDIELLTRDELRILIKDYRFPGQNEIGDLYFLFVK